MTQKVKVPEIFCAGKDDSTKVRAGLMVTGFAYAMVQVAKVSTMGAAKYAPHSWRRVDNAKERYFDAYMRHTLAHASGEKVDPESGLPHLAHAAWNALALIELEKS